MRGITTSQADRREISVAVINCNAVIANGKTKDAPVATWMDIFLVEPALNRGTGTGSNLYTDQKDIYVEMVKATTAANATAGQVIRRDKPYLIR